MPRDLKRPLLDTGCDVARHELSDPVKPIIDHFCNPTVIEAKSVTADVFGHGYCGLYVPE